MATINLSDLNAAHLGKLTTVTHPDGTSITGRITQINHEDERIANSRPKTEITLYAAGHEIDVDSRGRTTIEITD
ncbi:hypothetical protein HF995_07560 [Sanguibacter hominis ATCC BAA-789]|uniref:DUF5666 domain-containing protein n=1 Tax=Sanguibacter hominis ATCC BAA-789 TaxID=1312740 RepID=A0A9X5FJ97_9MICO|nr:hypothetical protein [Sanguibacter hominis]NKX93128.1 hypothetical protein [Sanguibacter hominis ATCC BAA-789]